MLVIIRHKYATAHSKAAYLRQIGMNIVEKHILTTTFNAPQNWIGKVGNKFAKEKTNE